MKPDTTLRENALSGKAVMKRLLKTLLDFYPVMLPLAAVLIVFNAIVGSIPALFMQNVIAVVENGLKTGEWSAVSGRIFSIVSLLAVFYVLSLLSGIAFNQMMAVMSQGSLKKLRVKMFADMQSLPIKYFDAKNHGDIMSRYTNDIDTLRQLISQTIPQLLISGVAVCTVFCIMIYLCVWMALAVMTGVGFLVFVTKKIGGRSARYFIRQQNALGEVEGYIEEIMNGQKVVKVFCHEDKVNAGFDAINDRLFREAEKSNKFANMLAPVLNNLGNILYVLVAVSGGLLLHFNVPNLSISGLALGISVVVPFLNITKQFAGNINHVSHQINAVIMGMAGARRIFALLDEAPESDEGDVTLVNVREEADGTLLPCEERTGVWAWRYPYSPDGSVSYTKLKGDVRLEAVDFSYTPDKPVLRSVSLYAKPGQKAAFVGATGAGKTTVANLLNRFYDTDKGEIRYDGINITKIKKADLRRSLGMVLQDTHLFTGTVMDNIRYGKLDASDEDCIRAAKLAGAHDFITRLPEGYGTVLTGNGASLSQGQRQLLSISRAAAADPPVMILDEATSSIDTRTEAIVQRGMDALMKRRTVFVIAHRLSTVMNSDVILVMEDGRIIERGDHATLVEGKGRYYQLYTGVFELS